MYKNLAGKKCKPYNGIKKSIKWLGEEGIKWGIATNKPRIYTDAILKENIFNIIQKTIAIKSPNKRYCWCGISGSSLINENVFDSKFLFNWLRSKEFNFFSPT